MTKRICIIDGCTKSRRARGMCMFHYDRWRSGTPMTAPKQQHFESPEDAFKARVKRDGACLVWTGSLISSGYGDFQQGKTRYLAHRYAWERVNGPIPDGMLLDHTCGNHACVKVDHLRLANKAQNAQNLIKGTIASNTSGYRGVYWSAQKRKWHARVKHDGKVHHVGYFDDVHEAGEAARALRLRLYTHNDWDRAA